MAKSAPELRVRGRKRRAPRPEITTVIQRPRRTSEEITRKLSADLRAEAELMENLKLQRDAAQRRRDALIVKLSDRGVSERTIGSMAKMSGPRVNQIYHGTTNGR